MNTGDPEILKKTTLENNCKIFSPLCLIYANLQTWGKPQYANGSLSAYLTIPIVPVEIPPMILIPNLLRIRFRLIDTVI